MVICFASERLHGQRLEAQAHEYNFKMAAEDEGNEVQSSSSLKEDKSLPAGLVCLIKPSIEALDNKVNDVR